MRIARTGVVVGDGSVRVTAVLPIALQPSDAENPYFREITMRSLAKIQNGSDDGWRSHAAWLPLQVYGTHLSGLIGKVGHLPSPRRLSHPWLVTIQFF